MDQCSRVFSEIEAIVNGLRSVQENDLFPSVDFVSKVKWKFSKKSKVLVLRSTLEACKSTLSVMLITMLLAERVSQRSNSTSPMLAEEEEQDKVMTQSLVIAEQCAVEQLEHYEDEVEKEEDAAMQLPGLSHATNRPKDSKRRRSRGRLVRMFSGLLVVTELPTPSSTPARLPNRSERASIWLDSILAPRSEALDMHPGKHRQRRLSSVGTANAPLQLLRKWTDQADHLDTKVKHPSVPHIGEINELWRTSTFSFSGSRLPRVAENVDQQAGASPTTGVARVPTDLISPKTARVQSIGFHVVVGVDGALESTSITQINNEHDDSHHAIRRAIMQEYGASDNVDEVALCLSYGGKTKVLKATDKPLQILKHYEELELDPRLFIDISVRCRSKPRVSESSTGDSLAIKNWNA
ncbi:hypothetical protein LTR37_012919 [Vermiconidia calcicola]|uniref:Uncharacterized protein n=1 Tax=Vermiconidia calcicola TaxID=1690605 RepID=A0ACC3MYZ2_9PEZI|nr:hypothetical protein LTR37_012919 [Vermiconidia calcicola]